MSPGAGFLYLHGFASAPSSTKAVELKAHLAALGVPLEVPDLNEGDGGFHGLTVGRMLAAAREAGLRARRAAGLPDGAPLVAIGSSLGGYTTALLAARDPLVAAVVLLAPAFDFPRRLEARIEREDKDGEVRRRGEFPTWHHGWKREETCSLELAREGRRYEAFPEVRCPALVIHGRKDDVVPCSLSEEFAAGRSNVRLVLLDDDHLLHGSGARIWEETRGHLAAWIG